MPKPIKKEMTEAQAWLLVAEEYQAGKTSKYLCLALNNDGGGYNSRVADIPMLLRKQMKQFLKEMLGVYLFAYPVHERTENNEARLTALCLFAAMAKTGDTVVLV